MYTLNARLQQFLLAVTAIALVTHMTVVRAADDRAALAGLSDGKIAFDIKEGEGKALLARLDSIDETRQSLIEQGVAPHFILAFRGPATRLVQTDQEKIKPEEREMAAKVASRRARCSCMPSKWSARREQSGQPCCQSGANMK